MKGVVEIEIIRFLMIYTLLIVVLFVMKLCKINQSKLLFVASLRMTVQLIIAGFVLTYIFKNPNPLFTSVYITAMILFATHRVISKNNWLNLKFKLAVFFSIMIVGLGTGIFFIGIVINQNVFNPQYAIPISGMIFGNTMTGLNLGLSSFHSSLESEKRKLVSLLNFGAKPSAILLPVANKALETALIPTLNGMIGLGIVSLPGMMTGQMLAGTLPTTAILYQISVMIVICTVVCMSVFSSIYIGYHTLYNEKNQFLF